MKKPNQISFCFQTDLPIKGNELKCPGHLELLGIGWCDNKRDGSTYDWEIEDVVLIVNGVRAPFYSIMDSLSKGHIEDHEVVKPAVFAHLCFLYGTDSEEDRTTDYAQDETQFMTSDREAA